MSTRLDGLDVSDSQRERLVALLEGAGRAIPAGVGFAEAWSRVPISDSQDHSSDGAPTSTRAENARIFFSSGGSTGSPKFTLLEFPEVLENSRVHGKGYRSAGIAPDDVVATWGIPGIMSSEFTAYLALAETGCRILPIGNSIDAASLIEVIREFRTTVLLVMPSNLNPMISLLRERGETIDSIRLVVTGGEPLLAADKERYSRFFGRGATFRSVFQTSDTGTIGYQCAYSDPREYHVHEELQFVEILNADGGGVGELVTTNMGRRLRPVIRQRSGDLARFLDGDCACGSADRRIQLHGRYGRFVKFGGEKFDLNWIVGLKEKLGIQSDDFQMSLERDEGARDRFLLRSNLVVGDEALQRRAVELFGELSEKVAVQIERGVVGPVRFGGLSESDVRLSSTGKIQYFIDGRA
ncbi:phenylacetate--CoA ligase family protein [Actinoplanes regularis]|uniref:phenylacetate--CoA ligase family protein n=1 Tax=Actinoplanes regularis TaxID=52697 RepID=UPI00255416A2|nr:AMP-binding protein [Actinoplanes regularis]